ncbi:MAG: hypothetical protein AB1801_21480 [Chloroflexota bacterium]
MPDETFSFIVRIWPEAVDHEDRIIVWRGSIDQVGSDNRFYFNNLDQIGSFIQNQLGLAAREAPDGQEIETTQGERDAGNHQ